MKAAGNRSRLIVASKTHTLEEEEIRAELAISLAALQTDYVDLYYLHQPPEDVATMQQVLDVFQKLKSEGKIRAVGASIKGPDVSQGTVDLCRQYIQSGKVDALQVIFSICRGKTREIFEEAHAAGVAIVARTVLESGFLTGKYKAGHTFSAPDHRHRWGQERLDTILADVATLQKQCVKAPYTSLAQFSTRFAYDTPGVTAIIPGARSPEQMAANLGVLQVGPMAAGLRDTTAAVFAGQDARFNTQ
mmetsp:Transcript_56561/g.133206  ORF Transcript_56561/g.133206 Transcript_56561/m.133206 type:complete len:247 (-) Transcript_56561:67-807(-)